MADGGQIPLVIPELLPNHQACAYCNQQRTALIETPVPPKRRHSISRAGKPRSWEVSQGLTEVHGCMPLHLDSCGVTRTADVVALLVCILCVQRCSKRHQSLRRHWTIPQDGSLDYAQSRGQIPQVWLAAYGYCRSSDSDRPAFLLSSTVGRVRLFRLVDGDFGSL